MVLSPGVLLLRPMVYAYESGHTAQSRSVGVTDGMLLGACRGDRASAQSRL